MYNHLDSEKWLVHISGIVSVLIGVMILYTSAKLNYVTSSEITVSRRNKKKSFHNVKLHKEIHFLYQEGLLLLKTSN